jgi:hypothetical protein
MKTTVILMGMLGATSLSAFSQTVTPPMNIEKSFNTKAPSAERVEWKYDEGDNRWEVDYEKDGTDCSMAFSRSGDWLETEMEMKMKDIPEAVRATIKSDFADYDIDEVEYVETPEGSFYELEAATKEGDEEKQYEIKISPEGEVVSKTEEQKEAE